MNIFGKERECCNFIFIKRQLNIFFRFLEYKDLKKNFND